VKGGARKRIPLYCSIYTHHQALNKIGNDVFASIVEFALSVLSVVIIFWGYILFRFASDNYTIILPFILGFLVAVCFSLLAALTLAVSCSSKSQHYCKLQQNPVHGNTKYDTRFWRSRKPITIRVGEQFSLETKDFVLQVFGNIILQNVTTLLVTF